MKIGMYTEDEIFKEIANGFLGRSMYDAIFDKIHALITENEQLQQENKILRENAEHNDKVVDKVNWENKQLQNNWNELKEWLYSKLEDMNNGIYVTNTLFMRNEDLLIIKNTFQKTLDKMQEIESRK